MSITKFTKPNNDLDGLNGGIPLYTRSIDFKYDHLDREHLANYENNTATDMGILEKTIERIYPQIKHNSFFNIDTIGLEEVNCEGSFIWSVPIEQDLTPILLKWEAAYEDTPCLGDSTIKMTFNKKLWEHGAIITPDLYSGLQLISTSDPIHGDEVEGYVFTFTLITDNNNQRYIPLQYLKTGTKWFQIGSYSGEYSTEYTTGGMISNASMTQYKQHVGLGNSQRYFTVTRGAAMSKTNVSGISHSLDQHRNMINMLLYKDGSLAQYYMSKNEQHLKAKKGFEIHKELETVYKQKGMDMYKSGEVHKTLIPEIEAFYTAQVLLDNRTMMLFGNGGSISPPNSKDVVKGLAPVGLFRQMMKGNVMQFNIETISLMKVINFFLEPLRFKSTGGLSNMLTGTPTITIKVGGGAWRLLYPQIQEYNKNLLSNLGAVVNANEFLVGSNQNKAVDFGFGSVILDAGEAVIKFEHAKEFDIGFTDPNNISNPIISTQYGSFRLSSFIMTVSNLFGERQNIVKMRNKNAANPVTHIYWVEGKMPYLGDPNRHAASSINNPGYEVYIEKSYEALWLKHPEDLFMLLPYNPKIGTHFGGNIFDTAFNSIQKI